MRIRSYKVIDSEWALKSEFAVLPGSVKVDDAELEVLCTLIQNTVDTDN